MVRSTSSLPTRSSLDGLVEAVRLLCPESGSFSTAVRGRAEALLEADFRTLDQASFDHAATDYDAVLVRFQYSGRRCGHGHFVAPPRRHVADHRARSYRFGVGPEAAYCGVPPARADQVPTHHKSDSGNDHRPNVGAPAKNCHRLPTRCSKALGSFAVPRLRSRRKNLGNRRLRSTWFEGCQDRADV